VLRQLISNESPALCPALHVPFTDLTVAITLYPSGVGNAILGFSLINYFSVFITVCISFLLSAKNPYLNGMFIFPLPDVSLF
jgi:hypothetical protein